MAVKKPKMLPLKRMLMRLGAGILFALVGISGLVGYPLAYLPSDSPVWMIYAAVNLLMGVLLLAECFTRLKGALERLLLSAALFLWGADTGIELVLLPPFSAPRFNWLEWGWLLLLHAAFFILLAGELAVLKKPRRTKRAGSK